MHYYTYAYLREDKTPYYIGKGEGNRVYYKYKNEVKPPKDKSRIIFLKQNPTEAEAFKHEIYMIAVFGRKDLGTGILYNRTDGGEGGSGAIRSQEFRKNISQSRKGKKYWNDGKGNHMVSLECPGDGWMPGMSEEWKRRNGEVKKGMKWWNDGRGNTKQSVKCPGKEWNPGRGKLKQIS